MQKISFCDGWTYKKANTSDAPIPVMLPHDAMLREKRSPLASSGINGAWFEGGDYVY